MHFYYHFKYLAVNPVSMFFTENYVYVFAILKTEK